MTRPRVSVVLPFFNAQQTLLTAVDSILRQTLQDWELILFDDGSTDDSAGIAHDLARRNPRLRLITSEHVGIVEALTRTCAEARAQFVARMDADDVSHPDRLERQLALTLSDPRIGLCGTLVRMVGKQLGYGRRRYERWINSLTTHESMERELFVECPIPHPTFFMPRDAYLDAGGYQDHGWPEDYDLCMRMFLLGRRFAKVDAPLLDWTDSPARLSMVAPRYSPAQFRAIKRHYMFLTHLAEGRPFCQWGAGEVGKPWLTEWTDRRPRYVIDVNPRKIGRSIHGYKIVSPENIRAMGRDFIVIAVGAPGARNEIRQWLARQAYTEVKDFIFVA